jgi:lipoyl(octanoyl) transferase
MTRPSSLGPLSVYLLGTIEFDDALRLQHALAYQVSGDRSTGALILCEHPRMITVGRHGRPAQLVCDPVELRARGWSVRWVNRGGGCFVHLPGQFAIYPVLALDHLGIGVSAYMTILQNMIQLLLRDLGVSADIDRHRPGLWTGGRMLADMGVAVRDWVSYYGAVVNVHSDLTLAGGILGAPQTSLERERRGRLRPALVRERLIEIVAGQWPFERTDLFFNHPLLSDRLSMTGARTQRVPVNTNPKL